LVQLTPLQLALEPPLQADQVVLEIPEVILYLQTLPLEAVAVVGIHLMQRLVDQAVAQALFTTMQIHGMALLELLGKVTAAVAELPRQYTAPM
jgi:hypothetical protein